MTEHKHNHTKEEEHHASHAEHHTEHEHKTNHEKVHETQKQNKWMLPLSFVLAFLFFIPFSALLGLILSGLSFMRSEKKTWPAISIVLNLLLGFFNFLFTWIFIEVFFLG